MEFITQIGIGGYSVVGYIIPFLIVLTIVVFFHELGHYSVARWNDVDVDAFAVGFGPEIIGYTNKRGERWKLCVIPLGGYVKFRGDANAASVPDHEQLQEMTDKERAGCLEHKTVGQRSAVVAAGPIANFILALIIFAGTFYFIGRVVSDPVISQVVENTAGERAGFQAGDIIRSIDGQEINVFRDVQRLVGPKHGIEMQFVVERDNKPVKITVVPDLFTGKDNFGNEFSIGRIGLQSNSEDANRRMKEFGIIGAIGEGASEAVFIVKRTFQFIGGIFAGRERADQLSGPIGIAQIAQQIWTLGFVELIYLTGLLSVSIGLLNLFPVPMLDGGHLIFYAYEAIMGKKLNENVQEVAFRIGIVLLLSLMLFATWNDVSRISTRLLG